MKSPDPDGNGINWETQPRLPTTIAPNPVEIIVNGNIAQCTCAEEAQIKTGFMTRTEEETWARRKTKL